MPKLFCTPVKDVSPVFFAILTAISGFDFFHRNIAILLEDRKTNAKEIHISQNNHKHGLTVNYVPK